MTAMARNIVVMCFSAFVLNTAILAYADVGYFSDNKQKIKEYIASDTLHYPNGANSLYSSYKLGSTPTSDSLLKKYLLKKK